MDEAQSVRRTSRSGMIYGECYAARTGCMRCTYDDLPLTTQHCSTVQCNTMYCNAHIHTTALLHATPLTYSLSTSTLTLTLTLPYRTSPYLTSPHCTVPYCSNLCPCNLKIQGSSIALTREVLRAANSMEKVRHTSSDSSLSSVIVMRCCFHLVLLITVIFLISSHLFSSSLSPLSFFFPLFSFLSFPSSFSLSLSFALHR